MERLRPIRTMQPTLVDAPPAGAGWIHEIKYDGYRLELLVEGGSARAYSRQHSDWTRLSAPIVAAAATLDCRTAILDGEIAVQDQNGVTQFGELRQAMSRQPHRLVYFAFDLLHLNGADLRNEPIESRRAQLRQLIGQAAAPIVMSDEFVGEGAAMFAFAVEQGLEGMVSKRLGSRYRSGDSKDWLKIKCWVEEAFDVIGVLRDTHDVPYAMLARNGIYLGAAHVSLPAELRQVFWDYIRLRGAPAPVAGDIKKPGARWVLPGLKATVRYLKGSGKLRHASVRGLEIDSEPR